VIDQGTLFDLFTLDAESGKLFWKKPPYNHPRLAGAEAGGRRETSKKVKSYHVVKINGRAFKRGHIVFCMIHGRWPKPMLDHIDGNSCNDVPANLREATATENAWNHKTRARRIDLPMGVRRNASGRYSARIAFHGRQITLGSYSTPEQAAKVYQAKRIELYGQFA
jgi:hypothetical protein